MWLALIHCSPVAKCSPVAVFPKHRVAVCTVPKSASSVWRKLLRRIYQTENSTTLSDANSWGCSSHGCLLDQPGAPAVLKTQAQARALMSLNYTFAHFARSPVERVFSMYTGFYHAGGPMPGAISFDTFLTRLEAGAWKGNVHTMGMLQECNLGFGRARPDWQLWTGHAEDAAQTQRRAHAYVHELFGSEVFRKVCSGWGCLERNASDASTNIFYSPRSTRAAENEANVNQSRMASYIARIEALYPEDVSAYTAAVTRDYGRYFVPSCAGCRH